MVWVMVGSRQGRATALLIRIIHRPRKGMRCRLPVQRPIESREQTSVNGVGGNVWEGGEPLPSVSLSPVLSIHPVRRVLGLAERHALLSGLITSFTEDRRA